MYFQFDARQEALYRNITDLCRQHLPENLDQSITSDKDSALKEYPENLHRALADAGVFKLAGQEVAGHVWEVTDALIITEALAASSFSAASMYLASAPVTTLLQYGCPPEQQERWVPGLVSGKTRYAFALTEPEAGSDLAALQCRGEKAGDGYVLNGHKNYVTGAAHADYITVVARAPNSDNIREATSVFMVPLDAPGLAIENRDVMAGRSAGCADIHLNGVKVGSDQLLGTENEDWGILSLARGYLRLLVAAAALGLARDVYARAHAHARERKQFGRPIGGFQAIAHRLADMATEIEAMQLLTYETAALADQGDVAEKETSMAKVYCTERLNEIVMSALKIMGGRASLRDEPISRKLDEATLLQTRGGTNEVQRTFIKKCLDQER